MHVCVHVCDWMSDWARSYDSRAYSSTVMDFSLGAAVGFHESVCSSHPSLLLLLSSPSPLLSGTSVTFSNQNSPLTMPTNAFDNLWCPSVSVVPVKVHQGCMWLGEKSWRRGKFLSEAQVTVDVTICKYNLVLTKKGACLIWTGKIEVFSSINVTKSRLTKRLPFNSVNRGDGN